MTALNHVEPGGAPLTLPLSSTVQLTKISVGPGDNNAYLLTTADAALLIDAADEPDRLKGVVGQRVVDTIVTTHRHADHWRALAPMAAASGASLVAGRPDVAAIVDGAGVEGVAGVWDDDQVPLGAERLSVIGLVGHTPGSITLVYAPAVGPKHLFTGDSLFPGGPGRTGSPADFTSLMDDLETKVFGRFPDDTVVHPGHGDDTTLGAERPHLGQWRARGW